MDTTGKLLVIELGSHYKWLVRLILLFVACTILTGVGFLMEILRQREDPDYKTRIEQEHKYQVELDQSLKAIEHSHR